MLLGVAGESARKDADGWMLWRKSSRVAVNPHNQMRSRLIGFSFVLLTDFPSLCVCLVRDHTVVVVVVSQSLTHAHTQNNSNFEKLQFSNEVQQSF